MSRYLIPIVLIVGLAVVGLVILTAPKNQKILSVSNTPTATPRPTPLPTAGLKSSPSPTTKATPKKTPTPALSPTLSPMASSIPIATPTPTSTPAPTPTPTATASPTPTPTPEPIIQSVNPGNINGGQLFNVIGTNFIINGVNQVQTVKVGQLQLLFSTQNSQTLLVSSRSGYPGTYDVSIISIDGTVSTLPHALSVNN